MGSPYIKYGQRHTEWPLITSDCLRRPDLIDFDSLNPEDKVSNLNLAFDAAEQLGIHRLLVSPSDGCCNSRARSQRRQQRGRLGGTRRERGRRCV